MKALFISIIIPFLTFGVQAQLIPEISEAKTIYCHGLDFSKAKMIGSNGFNNPYAIAEVYIQRRWNNIIFSEPDKYNIHKMCGKKKIINQRSIVDERNKKVTAEKLVIDSEHSISHVDIEKMIMDYPKHPDQDIGLVFIVESFNKTKEMSYVWVVICLIL